MLLELDFRSTKESYVLKSTTPMCETRLNLEWPLPSGKSFTRNPTFQKWQNRLVLRNNTNLEVGTYLNLNTPTLFSLEQ